MKRRITNYTFNLLSIVFALGAASCTNSSSQDPSVKRITNQDFISLQETDDSVQLVDVRTVQEYDNGHLEGAILIDFLQKDFRERVSILDKSMPIVVYCAVGGRSNQSTKILLEEGFTDIYDLKGGFKGWSSEGLPFE
ncbi:MAG: rhodanese-related sulfurtransferase [Cyclobacteriaceae bacterium]|jgi:rhodanese-related sulfurtransferase